MCFVAVFAAPSDSLVVDIVTNGSYSIKINNNTWLRNAPTFFRVDGQVFTAGKNLKLNMTTGSSGIDTLGTYQTTTFVYQAGGSEIHASIRTYELLPVIVFSQVSHIHLLLSSLGKPSSLAVVDHLLSRG